MQKTTQDQGIARTWGAAVLRPYTDGPKSRPFEAQGKQDAGATSAEEAR